MMAKTEISEASSSAPIAPASIVRTGMARDEVLPQRKAMRTLLLVIPTAAALGPLPQSSLAIPSETARTVVEASSAMLQRLDIERADIRTLNRIREIGTYPDGWDGADAQAASDITVEEAERFVRTLPLDKIHMPQIALAADGEINLLWHLDHFRLDLGFYGDGTYAYYGRTKDGEEFISDQTAYTKNLPKRIVELLKK